MHQVRLLPLEVTVLIDKVTALKIAAMSVNLAILAYLVWTKRPFGVRGGFGSLVRELADDVDWDSLNSRAPEPTAARR